ncbi:hypothetical protein QP635_03155 [Staphylococcus hominis]|uniref:Lipoprotein n=1 Tax=Staphylococcus phage HS12 TaxID=3056402 RepID=A0AA50AFI2_9VIRU|nr:hypothetical protein [Staphylococcus hominis]MDK7928893.1 hypothetical protein [Staphylococcus hominis]WLJ25898.1 MAG: protein of unknown function (DUF4969) [Staphylococcus phage HS12]
MKKFLTLIFSSALILGACGSGDTSNNNSDTKSEDKTEEKSQDNKGDKSKENNKSKEEKNSTEEQNAQEAATNEQSSSNQDSNYSDTNQNEQSDEENEYPYTAQQYNELVDEYNSLTDGETMDHVNRGVTEKEYSQLQGRINTLYEEGAQDKFKSEPSTSVDNIEHDPTDDLATASEYNDIVDEYNTMKNRPGNKSRVNSSVPQSQYNTLVDEYNELVDQEYEEAGY